MKKCNKPIVALVHKEDESSNCDKSIENLFSLAIFMIVFKHREFSGSANQ